MGLHRLRWKLVLLFLAATLLPLCAILWVSSALMTRSLAFVDTGDVARLSASLERTAREYYRQARDELRADAALARRQPERFASAARAGWPPEVQQFADSGDGERFVLSAPDGDGLHYLVRHGDDVWRYSRQFDAVRLGDVTRVLQGARARSGDLQARDLPRGFTIALVVASAGIWLLSLAVVLFMASRVSAPIEHLTAGLSELAHGRFETRLAAAGDDEIGRAMRAFNETAARLEENRNRLVYLTQVASWQMLARKMAHELKNSLTPIRLTVEEILARHPPSPPAASAGRPEAPPAASAGRPEAPPAASAGRPEAPAAASAGRPEAPPAASAGKPEAAESGKPEAASPFLQQAARIVADEVESLERRVRAFSEFAAEPPNSPAAIDLNVLLDERLQLLRAAHPDVTYRVEREPRPLTVWADADQVKGILTNVLENAAEAAGEGGVVLGVTRGDGRDAIVEVHDSGPGLTPEARAMLFEPTISFKKRGMGLGLAIARKNALVAGGDLRAIDGRLGGAAFRLVIPLQK